MSFIKTAGRLPSTVFSVGHLATGGDRVFFDYSIPGGQTVRVLEQDVFMEAVERSGRVLRELSKKYRNFNGSVEKITKNDD